MPLIEIDMAWAKFSHALKNESACDRYANRERNCKKSWEDFAKEVREKKYKATRTSSYFSL